MQSGDIEASHPPTPQELNLNNTRYNPEDKFNHFVVGVVMLSILFHEFYSWLSGLNPYRDSYPVIYVVAKE